MKPRPRKLLPLSVTAAVMCSTLRLTTAAAASGEPARSGFEQVGQASFYSGKYVGHRTADGSRYDPSAMTAAHQWLPLGTRLKVVREGSDKAVVVTVTDRQAHTGRILDLSRGAAEQLGMIGAGTTRVRLIALSSTDASLDDALAQQASAPATVSAGRTHRRRGLTEQRTHASGHAGTRSGHPLAMADRTRRVSARHHPASHLI